MAQFIDLKTSLSQYILGRAVDAALAWGIHEGNDVKIIGRDSLYIHIVVRPGGEGPPRNFSVTVREHY